MITYKHGFHKGGDFVLSKKKFSYIAKKIRTFATLYIGMSFGNEASVWQRNLYLLGNELILCTCTERVSFL